MLHGVRTVCLSCIIIFPIAPDSFHERAPRPHDCTVVRNMCWQSRSLLDSHPADNGQARSILREMGPCEFVVLHRYELELQSHAKFPSQSERPSKCLVIRFHCLDHRVCHVLRICNVTSVAVYFDPVLVGNLWRVLIMPAAIIFVEAFLYHVRDPIHCGLAHDASCCVPFEALVVVVIRMIISPINVIPAHVFKNCAILLFVIPCIHSEFAI